MEIITNFIDLELLKGSLSMLAAIYVLFNTVVGFCIESVVYMTECMAVFYICKTNYKNHKI
jgi:hypothetical protein